MEKTQAQTQFQIGGLISKYSIEMELNSFDNTTGCFNGRYRYAGKKNYLNMKVWIMGQCLYIEEFYKDKTSGYFYLSLEEDSLTGWWTNGSKDPLPVCLKVNQGNTKQLSWPNIAEVSKKTNTKITGTYGVETYFVNELHYPAVEITFNGGYVSIEELAKDSIKFSVNVVCGPTYHIAMAEGVAKRNGKEYIYTADLTDGNSELCEITFNFSQKSVLIKSNTSFNCGFGARAYLDHAFIKINNLAFFEDGTSLEKIKQQSR